MIRISDKFQLLTSTFGSQAIRICTTLVMARLISPAENGAYFLLLAVPGVVMALGDFSIPYSLIQLREFEEETAYDTAMLLSILLYLFYGVVTIGAGEALTHHYHDGRFWKLAVILALSNLFGAVYNIQLAMLNRHLKFRAESWQNFIFSISAATTGIAFALLHWGVYAFVFQLLAGQLVANAFIYAKVPMRVPRMVTGKAVRRYFELGGPVSMAAYVSNVEGSIVNLLVNRLGGQYGLGVWGKAVQVQALFSQNAMSGFQRVAYPLLCKASGDKERSRELFVRVSTTLMLASAFFMVVLGADSEDLVRIVLGPDWTATAALLRITAFAIPAGGLTTVAYMTTLANGKSRVLLVTSILNFVLFIPAVFLVQHFMTIYKELALSGMAVCWAASRYFIAVSLYEKGRKQLGVKLRDVAVPVVLLLMVGMVSMVLSRGVLQWVPLRTPLIRFAFVNLVGAVVFVIGALLVQRDAVLYAFKMASGGRKAAGHDMMEAMPEMPNGAASVADATMVGQEREMRI